jgi:pimeloyl-ACP methyl ester carboxylesterase
MTERPMLNFKSINDSATTTILLIHGAYSSLEEWTLISSHLNNYHLLIPDLPGHGRGSSALLPLSVAGAADLLADLITTHAREGRASIVGLSLGGYTALNLASRYPDLVDAVFVSGCHHSWGGPWEAWFMGHVMAMSILGMVGLLPKRWLVYLAESRNLHISDALYEDMVACCRYDLGVRVAKSISEDAPPAILNRVRARTAMVVGGNEFWAVEAVERVKILRKGNVESRGFTVKGMEHAWDLQDPAMFAAGILKWIEGGDMPDEFVVIKEGD